MVCSQPVRSCLVPASALAFFLAFFLRPGDFALALSVDEAGEWLGAALLLSGVDAESVAAECVAAGRVRAPVELCDEVSDAGRESDFNSIVLVRSPKRLICALSGETQRQPRPFWAKALSDADTERPRPLADCSGVSMTDVDAARFGSARSDMGGQQAATR
jgi:hypothetical protein